MQKHIHLGLFGFGCVGQGLYRVLERTPGVKADIKKICIKHHDKPRPLDQTLFTTNKNEILNDPDIDVVVELIDDAEAALEIVSEAMANGKAVVTANKKMIAENLHHLYKLQQKYKVPLLYEASCCASIPIIRNLEEYYDNDLVNSVEGIFNGSTNYILTSLFNNGHDFESALSEAQLKGFAETDPTLDIEGFDPKFKLCIILLHAFGLFVEPENIFNYGISNINAFDITYARQRGSRIKLIARCFKTNDNDVVAYCMPEFVNGDSRFTSIDNEFNAVDVETVFSQSQLFVGKGAGDEPTGSAVLSDISALTYHYKYEYKKLIQQQKALLSSDYDLEVYFRYKNGTKVNLNEFSSLKEKYEASDQSYVIGTINLSRLQKADWIRDNNVNVILV